MKFIDVKRTEKLVYYPQDDIEAVNKDRLLIGKKPIKYKEYRRKLAVFLEKKYHHVTVILDDKEDYKDVRNKLETQYNAGLYIIKNTHNHIHDYAYIERQKSFRDRQKKNTSKEIKAIHQRHNASNKLKLKMQKYRKRRDAWNEYLNK